LLTGVTLLQSSITTHESKASPNSPDDAAAEIYAGYSPTSTTDGKRLKKLGGYCTGFVGKWHLGNGQYAPENRGFDDFMDGTFQHYKANYDLTGKAIPRKEYSVTSNRVLYQGQAGAAFIEKNHAQPVFLCLALYGPHLPRVAPIIGSCVACSRQWPSPA
jgi:arylsulfatase A-like enzyme